MSERKKIVLEFRDITKKYSGTLALNKVSMSINEGEVFGLVGKNGAGKSTLLKILSGAIQDYEGDVVLQGNIVRGNPHQIIEKGISTVYQGLNLALDLTVEENIFLGLEKTKAGKLKVVNHETQREKVKEYLEEFGIELNPNIFARDLNIDIRQLIAIVRAVSQNVKVITLDEPTSSLSHRQIEKLFNVVDLLKKRGVTIIFVSHHLNEVFQITDRIGVLRDGRLEGIVATETATTETITNMMLGKRISLEEKNVAVEAVDYQSEKEILKVSNLTRRGYFSDISFNLYGGEILGIAGLIGSGKTHLVKSIFSADPYDEGHIYLDQKQVDFTNPFQALLHGIAYLPEDRHNEAVFKDFNVGDNITVENMKELIKFGVINRGKRIGIGDRYIKKYQIKTTGYIQPITSLSGGNQQKAVFARLMYTNCRLLILNNPTQGVDVMSKREIHTFMADFVRENNRGIIVVSNELPELVGLCHRVLVLKEGKLVRTVTRDELDETKIMGYML